MSLDSDEIMVGQNGSISVAAYGTTLPTSINSVIHADFLDLGYLTEDGVTFTDGKTINDVNAWQSFYPLRKIISARESMVKFALEQWNIYTVQLAFGGGSVTEPSTGEYKYVPPSPEEVDYRSMVVDWQDGTTNYRLVIPRGLVTESVETSLVRSEQATLPITFSVLGADAQDAWYFLTDDPGFDTATAAS